MFNFFKSFLGKNQKSRIRFYIFFRRDLGFAGNVGLAQTAAFAFETIMGFYIFLSCPTDMFSTGVFVMTCFCDRPHRAAGDAFAAISIRKLRAIRMMIAIGPPSRRYLNASHH
jgi:hypothetical protein